VCRKTDLFRRQAPECAGPPVGLVGSEPRSSQHLLHIRKAFSSYGPERAIFVASAEFLMTDAQQPFHNLSGMLTDQGTGKTVARWGCREFQRGILDLPHPQGWVLQLQIHVAVAELGIVFHPVFRTLHRQGADASGLAALR